jgi:hypothetical protein
MDLETMLWQEHLSDLAKAATGDPEACVHIDASWPVGLDGSCAPTQGSGRDVPFITVRGSLDRVGQEGTVLHEAQHWSRRDDQDVNYQQAIQHDRELRRDEATVPWELRAAEGALALLGDEHVLEAVSEPVADVEAYLQADLIRTKALRGQ